jgi:hypothetical protein
MVLGGNTLARLAVGPGYDGLKRRHNMQRAEAFGRSADSAYSPLFRSQCIASILINEIELTRH